MVIVVKWSACWPPTWTIWVQIQLNTTVFLNFFVEKNEAKQNEVGIGPFKKVTCLVEKKDATFYFYWRDVIHSFFQFFDHQLSEWLVSKPGLQMFLRPKESRLPGPGASGLLPPVATEAWIRLLPGGWFWFESPTVSTFSGQRWGAEGPGRKRLWRHHNTGTDDIKRLLLDWCLCA